MSEFVALACGLLMPFVISWLKDCNWPDWVKVLLSLGVSVLGGALAAAATGQLDLNTLTTNSGIVFTSATVFYKAWFANTSMNNRLEQRRTLRRGQHSESNDSAPHVQP